jgi:pilus assembly protein CpaC
MRALALLALPLALLGPLRAQAQLVGIPTGRQDVVVIPLGQSQLILPPAAVARVSIGDPEVADAMVITPREVLVNARRLGTTTLIVWDVAGARRTHTIEVTTDASALGRIFQTLFPGEPIAVTTIGNTVILSGTLSTQANARRAVEVAQATGAVVVDNLLTGAPQQVLLQVRIAEVSQAAIREFGSQISALNPHRLNADGDWLLETLSEGLMRLMLLNPDASLDVVLRALRTSTSFRSLAEPNLMALDGAEASFLAGGEFPFPIAQPGSTAGAVTIQWREFGVRLNFTPNITTTGNIRLTVAPEVSQLDFASGLVLSGFAVPTLLTRRAETSVELRDGQTFAIAGLLDNTTLESATRLPVLGDLPVIGSLFRTRLRRQDRTELLVLVTPRLVQPHEAPPPVPTGEPEEWRWEREMRPVPNHPMPYAQPRARAREGTITEGMTQREVMRTLGHPWSARFAGSTMYMHYSNPCRPGCTDDVVVLRDDRVVSARLTEPRRFEPASAAGTSAAVAAPGAVQR